MTWYTKDKSESDEEGKKMSPNEIIMKHTQDHKEDKYGRVKHMDYTGKDSKRYNVYEGDPKKNDSNRASEIESKEVGKVAFEDNSSKEDGKVVTEEEKIYKKKKKKKK